MFRLFKMTLFAVLLSWNNCSASDCDLSSIVNPLIEAKKDSVLIAKDHEPMSVVNISIPVSVQDMNLTSMEITQGEVEEFYIPLAFVIKGSKAITKIIGTTDSIKRFELIMYYESSECNSSVQIMLLSNNPKETNQKTETAF